MRDGFVPGMQVQASSGDGSADEQPATATHGEGVRREPVYDLGWLGAARVIVRHPDNHQNRKARRAAEAKRRRDAWHAFKAGRREGMSRSTAEQFFEQRRAAKQGVAKRQRINAAVSDLAAVLRGNEPTESR